METAGQIRAQARCRCGAEIAPGAPFCGACGKVQPPRDTDLFAFLGLERRLGIDEARLEKEFYRLSRRLHPDVYAQAGGDEQQWSLAQSSRLNDAYRTLKDPVARTKYLLRLEGVQLEEDGAQGEARVNPSKAPPDLLEEVFELNMQLEEMRANAKLGEDDPELRRQLAGSRGQFAGQLAALDGELRERWADWDRAAATGEDGRKAKEAMTALLQRRNYLRNLVGNVSEALGES